MRGEVRGRALALDVSVVHCGDLPLQSDSSRKILQQLCPILGGSGLLCFLGRRCVLNTLPPTVHPHADVFCILGGKKKNRRS